ncbi:hypothetical protein J6590_001140 [Homalodisca vitripennis]|nr:hypothetical protein J6590_001140 [Homalodisca vitripennis]
MIPRGVIVLGVLLASAWADPLPEISGLDDCFKKDSISCVQIQLFRNVRSFFDQESVDLFGGLSLVKNAAPKDKTARALEESSESQLLAAKDVDERENVLESYALGKISNFFQERSLSWNLSPVVNEVAATARSIASNIPPEQHISSITRAIAVTAAEERWLEPGNITC